MPLLWRTDEEQHEQGVMWKLHEESGKTSPIESGKRIWSAGVEAMGQSGCMDPGDCLLLVQEIRADPSWRNSFGKHLSSVASLAAGSSDAAYYQAEASLAALHDEFVFVRGRREIPLMEACCNAPLRGNLIGESVVETVTVQGRHSAVAAARRGKASSLQNKGQGQGHGRPPPAFFFRVGGGLLSGPTLVKQVEAWVRHGGCEPSAAASLRALLDPPEAANNNSEAPLRTPSSTSSFGSCAGSETRTTTKKKLREKVTAASSTDTPEERKRLDDSWLFGVSTNREAGSWNRDGSPTHSTASSEASSGVSSLGMSSGASRSSGGGGASRQGSPPRFSFFGGGHASDHDSDNDDDDDDDDGSSDVSIVPTRNSCGGGGGGGGVAGGGEAESGEKEEAGGGSSSGGGTVDLRSSLRGLLSGRVFVLLGGTASLAPTELLLSLGATVACVCRRGSSRLAALVKFARASSGTLLLPRLRMATTSAEAGGDVGEDDEEEEDDKEEKEGKAGAVAVASAGLDILTHTPEVAEWVLGIAERLVATAKSNEGDQQQQDASKVPSVHGDNNGEDGDEDDEDDDDDDDDDDNAGSIEEDDEVPPPPPPPTPPPLERRRSSSASGGGGGGGGGRQEPLLPSVGIVLGCYVVNLEPSGELHVRCVAAMDAISATLLDLASGGSDATKSTSPRVRDGKSEQTRALSEPRTRHLESHTTNSNRPQSPSPLPLVGSCGVELAHLCSTEANPHLWPQECRRASGERWGKRPWYVKTAATLGGRVGLRANVAECAVEAAKPYASQTVPARGGGGGGGNGGLYRPRAQSRVVMASLLRGPHHALAKQAQTWRAILARRDSAGALTSLVQQKQQQQPGSALFELPPEAGSPSFRPCGRVSANFAPAYHRNSNASGAGGGNGGGGGGGGNASGGSLPPPRPLQKDATLSGLQNFGCMVAVEADTAATVMGLLLLADLATGTEPPPPALPLVPLAGCRSPPSTLPTKNSDHDRKQALRSRWATNRSTSGSTTSGGTTSGSTTSGSTTSGSTSGSTNTNSTGATTNTNSTGATTSRESVPHPRELRCLEALEVGAYVEISGMGGGQGSDMNGCRGLVDRAQSSAIVTIVLERSGGRKYALRRRNLVRVEKGGDGCGAVGSVLQGPTPSSSCVTGGRSRELVAPGSVVPASSPSASFSAGAGRRRGGSPLSAETAVNPSLPTAPLNHPWELFSSGSFHGGPWRSAYSASSMGPAAWALGVAMRVRGTAAATAESTSPLS